MVRNRHHYFAVGAFMIAIAIVLGAFGAHGLEKKVTLKYLGTWKTATEYLMYNALGILAFAAYKSNYKFHSPSEQQLEQPKLMMRLSIIAIFSGVFIFSTSLYIVALNEIFSPALKTFGRFAPIGGLLMTLGWAGIGFHFLTHKHPK